MKYQIDEADKYQNGDVLSLSIMNQMSKNLKKFRSDMKPIGFRQWWTKAAYATPSADCPELIGAALVYPTTPIIDCAATIRSELPRDIRATNETIKFVAFVKLVYPGNVADGACTGTITNLQLIHANSAVDAYKVVCGPQTFDYFSSAIQSSVDVRVLTGTISPQWRLGVAAAINEELWLNLKCTAITYSTGSTHVYVASISLFMVKGDIQTSDVTLDADSKLNVILTPKLLEQAVDADYTVNQRLGWKSIIHEGNQVFRFATEQIVNAIYPHDDHLHITGFPSAISAGTYWNICDAVKLATSQAEMYVNTRGRTYDGTNIRILISFWFQRTKAGLWKAEWKPMSSGAWATIGSAVAYGTTPAWERLEADIPVASAEDIIIRVSAKNTTTTDNVKMDAMAIRFYHANILEIMG
jgi:hypothetical protein